MARAASIAESTSISYEPFAALGPDRQLIKVPADRQIDGTFEVYLEDGVTLLGKTPGKAVPSSGYVLETAAK